MYNKMYSFSLGNPIGVMIANVLAPVIVTEKSRIPFMVGFFTVASDGTFLMQLNVI